MRRPSGVLLSVITLVLMAGVAGCGGGISALQTPPDMLAAAMDASENMNSATGTFQLDMLVHIDSSDLPSEDLGMLGIFKNPITASGTLSFSSEAQAADVDVTLASSGVTFNLGLRFLQENIWLRVFNQWYDMTPLLEETMGDDAALWEERYDPEDMKELLARLGVDPVDWLEDSTMVGQEDLAGRDVYHLACAPDLAVMLRDVIRLLQNREFMDLVDPTGSLLEAMGTGMPTPADIAEIEHQIPKVFRDLTLDLWIDKSDAMLRQAEAYANIVPPAEEGFEGLAGLELTMTVSLDDINKPVDISAPESFLPYTDLEDMFGGDSGMQLPFMEGLQGVDLLQ